MKIEPKTLESREGQRDLGCVTMALLFRDRTLISIGFAGVELVSFLGLYFALSATRIAISHVGGADLLRSSAEREYERRAALDSIVEERIGRTKSKGR